MSSGSSEQKYFHIEKHPDTIIVIGTHGTALSTIIQYYNPGFGYDEFTKIRSAMPWIVEFTFDKEQKCTQIQSYEQI